MGLFRRRRRKARTKQDQPTGAEVVRYADPGDTFDRLVEREWERLTGPGTWWTGGERLAIATDARRAVAGEAPSGDLPAPVEEATRRLAVEAATIRETDIARWTLDGLDPFAYVEITGIVSRLMALDVASFGLNRKLPLLPEPREGIPSRTRADGAEVTTGWVPTVGPASATSSLSAVPLESEAMFDIHGVLYLSLEEMAELEIQRDGLSRPQMELAAARTSFLNDCFY